MPAVRFLPERTDFFVPFRAAGATVAEAGRLLTDLVARQEHPDQAVARLRELERRGDECAGNSSHLRFALRKSRQNASFRGGAAPVRHRE